MLIVDALSNTHLKDEAENCSDAKIVHGNCGVEGHITLLTALHDELGSLNPPTVTQAKIALKIVYKTKKENKEEKAWQQLKTEDKDDWIETMCRRLRNMMRVVSQATGKTKPAAWTKKLPFCQQPDADEDTQAPDTRPDADQDTQAPDRDPHGQDTQEAQELETIGKHEFVFETKGN